MKNFEALFSFILFYSSFVSGAFELAESQKCDSHISGHGGICLEPKNCEAFKTDRDKLKICSFKHKTPIICCPNKIENIPKVGNAGGKRKSAYSKDIKV